MYSEMARFIPRSDAIFRMLFCFSLLGAALASEPQKSLLGASLALGNAFSDLLPSEPVGLEPVDPKPRLVMYVQTFTDTAGAPLSLLPLLEQDTKVTHVILGSIHLHEQPGKIMLNNEPLDSDTYDELWKEVRILQENDVKVLALLGGAAPGTYDRLTGNDTKFEAYYRPLLSLLKKHHFDGLDVDIEEKVPLKTPLRLLHRLYADLGPSFLLTMAPLATALSEEEGTNLSGFSYFDLDRLAVVAPKAKSFAESRLPESKVKLVAWYNAQFYGGYAGSTYMYNAVVAAGFDSTRLVFGVTTSAAGYPNGFTPLKKLLTTVRSLKEKYGEEFGGVSGWEYWDAGSGDKDMGMQIGGEPWRWVSRVAQAIFGVDKRRGRGTKKSPRSRECMKRCMGGEV